MIKFIIGMVFGAFVGAMWMALATIVDDVDELVEMANEEPEEPEEETEEEEEIL